MSDSKNKNNKKRGELAEVSFLLKATAQGLVVSQPYGDSSKYDFIVDNGKALKKIQVKSCGSKKIGSRYKVTVASGSYSKTRYTSIDFDYLVCYSFDANAFWIFPFDHINGRISIYFSDKMIENKEAWNLLTGDT